MLRETVAAAHAIGLDRISFLAADVSSDAFNRPVSRQIVERQVAGASAAAGHGAELSRLPMARLLWRVLSQVLWGLALRAGLPAPEFPSTCAAPIPSRPGLPLCLGLLWLAAAASTLLRPTRSLETASLPTFRPLVLRC